MTVDYFYNQKIMDMQSHPPLPQRQATRVNDSGVLNTKHSRLGFLKRKKKCSGNLNVSHDITQFCMRFTYCHVFL